MYLKYVLLHILSFEFLPFHFEMFEIKSLEKFPIFEILSHMSFTRNHEVSSEKLKKKFSVYIYFTVYIVHK